VPEGTSVPSYPDESFTGYSSTGDDGAGILAHAGAAAGSSSEAVPAPYSLSDTGDLPAQSHSLVIHLRRCGTSWRFALIQEIVLVALTATLHWRSGGSPRPVLSPSLVSSTRRSRARERESSSTVNQQRPGATLRTVSEDTVPFTRGCVARAGATYTPRSHRYGLEL
jgi:hypothetical protein